MDHFDPPSAVKHWNNAGSRARRPNFITDTGDIEDSDESYAVANILDLVI